jgi:hypothetical protein
MIGALMAPQTKCCNVRIISPAAGIAAAVNWRGYGMSRWQLCEKTTLLCRAYGRGLVANGFALSIGVAGCGVEDMAAETPGWRRGSSSEAANRCDGWRRALRAKTVPVIMGDGGLGIGHPESEC